MADPHPGEVVGVSEGARALRQFVCEAARSLDPVMLAGEAGTGKQLLARLIHDASARSRGPFLMIDCSLYYERELRREIFGYHPGAAEGKGKAGLFEFAARGTCYLSRIEELSPSIQASLSIFLATGKFARLGDGRETASGVRLVASTEKNIEGLVEAGLFDGALYAQLSRLQKDVPSLRDRRPDIPGLVEFMVDRYAAEHVRSERMTVSRDAIEALQAYPWPGNLDEFGKEIRRLLDAGVATVGTQTLSTDISSYWLGQHCDPEVRRVLEELDGYIREFKVLSRLESDLGEKVGSLESWLIEDSAKEHDLMEEL